MTTQTVRVRFAPSPTGHLHIGNARTALFNWLFARHHGGQFILRIEDTDVERSTKESDELILQDMAWMGLDYDEGPDIGGSCGPYRQSERLELYREYAQKLIAQGDAYYCYCSEEELDTERQQLMNEGKTPMYSGRCRNLSKEQEAEFQAQGRIPTIRFKVSPGAAIVNPDLVRGDVSIEREMIGDFVIVRSNGIPSYNYAVVIDDALMKITHVMRGDDHLTNTARQILLYDALEFQKPLFGHLSMILGPDHSRLSKRHGATSVSQYRDMGYLPEALVNYLALLGWSPQDDAEILPLDELVRQFDVTRVSKSAAVFDLAKLNWMCGQYIRDADVATVTTQALPFYQAAGDVSADPSAEESAHLKQIVTTARRYVTHLAEMPEHSRIFFDSELNYDEEAQTLLKNADVQTVIETLRDVLNSLDEIDAQNCRQIFKDVKAQSKIKGKPLFMGIRIAVTGALHGPELNEILQILGKSEALKRIEATLQHI